MEEGRKEGRKEGGKEGRKEKKRIQMWQKKKKIKNFKPVTAEH